MHFELLSCAATAAATTGTAATALAGDSLVIKNGINGKRIRIVSAWQTNQTAGFGQVAFPTGHDTTRGFRAGVAIGLNPTLLPLGINLDVHPQEQLSVTLGATAVAGDVENMSMLVHYDDLPGMDAVLMHPEQLSGKVDKITTIEQSITSAAGPGYSGEVVINTTTDLLLNNRDYAVLGMSCRTQVHAMTLRGPDVSNIRVGCPGLLRPELTSQWFMAQSRANNLPMIPVINSGNKAATFMGVATDENAGTFLVTLYLALLKERLTKS